MFNKIKSYITELLRDRGYMLLEILNKQITLNTQNY